LNLGRRLDLASYSPAGSMGRADDFRAKAIECDKLADEAWDSETKQMLQEAAKNWRVLAVQVERWSGAPC
jgi:hypothetical protein